MSEHKVKSSYFAVKLLTSLEDCCNYPRVVTFHTLKELMWESFYKLSTSDSHNNLWSTFLEENVGFRPDPIFYQFVTTTIMKRIIKDRFPPSQSTQEPEAVDNLDYEESNALRYTAGYVVRSLTKKLKRSAHPLKDELLLCLEEMVESKPTNY